MKNLTRITVPCIAFLFLFGPSFAQKKRDRDEAVVTIKINGSERDIEEYFEEWGEDLGRKIERMFDDSHIHIDIDEDDWDIKLNNISVDIDDFAESIAEAVSKIVTNMTIELHDIDPYDVSHNRFEFDGDEDLDHMIDDIERRYKSKVENIDRLKIKIREDYVKIDMDVTLENGKSVDKTKIFAH